ncbi:MAG: metallophosphoesterase [Candidatus Micrarchaeota archaeon]|nr:metallophosphoesterase [Candidatus Micrarchaeota archaeon]
MKINKDLEIVDGLPFLYIKSLNALVCSDLHLGYEGVMADRGTFLPKVNLSHIKEAVRNAAEMTGARKIIVDGDIKNEFSTVHVEEFNEFYDFMKFLKELGMEEVILIKGNHDNFIDRLSKEPIRAMIYSQEALIGDYLFFHGEELPQSKGGKMLIMGHVHPAISLFNKMGTKEKLKCFLKGRLNDGRGIMVVPAMNYFAEGVGVNMEDVGEMAPIFKKMLNVNSMRALCIGEGEILDFGTIKQLSLLR